MINWKSWRPFEKYSASEFVDALFLNNFYSSKLMENEVIKTM